MKFTEDDDSFLVHFVAESHSKFKRKGELLYKKLVQQHADSRHSWKSWQHYYVKYADYFDHLIEQYQLEHSIPISPTATNQIQKRYGFTEAEDALIVEHIAKNDLSGQRKGLSLYNVLSQRGGKQYKRSSKSWCHRYSKNADYFDRLVDIYRREHNVNKHLISTLGTPVASSSVGMSLPSTLRNHPSASLPLLSAPKSTRFKHEEDMNLVAYLSENTSSSPRIGLDERNTFKLYSNLTRSNAHFWAASRSANSWFIRYTSNMAYIETHIEQYRLRSSTLTRTLGVTLGKRKRDPRVLPSSSTSASSPPEDSATGKEDNRQGIAYKPRKRLRGSGFTSWALDSGDAVDRAGDEYNQDEDHNQAYRRSKRLRAAPLSRIHSSDNSDEESENEEEEVSAPIEETGSLGKAGFFEREGARTLPSPTMRVTRRLLRNSRAQDNDQDEDDDLIEVDSYLRGCSVGSVDSVESNMQGATDPPNSHSDKSSGTRVRFASPCVSAKYTSTTIATLSPSLTELQEFSATPIYVWRRVKIPPRIRTLTSTDRPDTMVFNSPYDSDDCGSASADADNGSASVMPAHSSRRLRSNSLVRTRNATKDSAKDPSHPKTKHRVSTRLQTPSPSTRQPHRTRSMSSSGMGLGGRVHSLNKSAAFLASQNRTPKQVRSCSI
ncbi:hypothetical protein C8J55DRAFT_558261 [Lentinula edodes]|uniref:DNA-binding protein RAP1 n=1 Tax=Lentinula lateritia TaxID=40482 RepID=A0A9W9DVS0_9AGAR|nr:hypothetical protein C8J55DRAFT_558261 [Lentinula edodes]